MRNGVLVVQAALVAACAGLAWFNSGGDAGLAALYGGGVAAASAWLLSTRIASAGELAKRSVRYSLYSLYFGALQRFIFVMVCLGVGLGVMKLEPVPLLLSFGAAQLAFMIAAGREALRHPTHPPIDDE